MADTKLVDTLGPAVAGVNVLYNAADLTVLNVVWPPLVSLFPHDHRMWAAIGIYAGQEDNTFYRRQGASLVSSGAKQVGVGEVLVLGDDAIHSVDNPTRAGTPGPSTYTAATSSVSRAANGTPRPSKKRPTTTRPSRRVRTRRNAVQHRTRMTATATPPRHAAL